MSHYSKEDRIFLIQNYYANDKNVTLTLRKWSSQFKNRSKPDAKMIDTLVKKFERTGSVLDDIESRKNKEKTARTPEIIDEVKRRHSESPNLSVRQLGQQAGTSSTTAWRILNKDLELFPYKVQVAQQLTEKAVEKRLAFATDMCDLIDECKINTSEIIFSDEAHFWLEGYVNRQNYRIWGTERPELLRTKPLHPKKLTVWCGLTAERIIGPFFVEESITGSVYNDFLTTRFLPVAEELDLLDHHFQQDGAPPHTTRENLTLLRDNFGSKVIARNFPETFKEGIAWPPYSPDLSPLDFFLWGYVKDRVYKNNPKSLVELKLAIETTIEAIPIETLQKTVENFERRVRMLIHTGGRHIENILH